MGAKIFFLCRIEKIITFFPIIINCYFAHIAEFHDRLSKLDEILCSSIVVSQFLACIKEQCSYVFLWGCEVRVARNRTKLQKIQQEPLGANGEFQTLCLLHLVLSQNVVHRGQTNHFLKQIRRMLFLPESKLCDFVNKTVKMYISRVLSREITSNILQTFISETWTLGLVKMVTLKRSIDFKPTCNHNNCNMYCAWIVWHEIFKHSKQVLNWEKKKKKKGLPPFSRAFWCFWDPWQELWGTYLCWCSTREEIGK